MADSFYADREFHRSWSEVIDSLLHLFVFWRNRREPLEELQSIVIVIIITKHLFQTMKVHRETEKNRKEKNNNRNYTYIAFPRKMWVNIAGLEF